MFMYIHPAAFSLAKYVLIMLKYMLYSHKYVLNSISLLTTVTGLLMYRYNVKEDKHCRIVVLIALGPYQTCAKPYL